jgi:hypothetical protein
MPMMYFRKLPPIGVWSPAQKLLKILFAALLLDFSENLLRGLEKVF